MFKKIKSKLKGIDKFYRELNVEQIALYQKYFERIIDNVDVHNMTGRSLNRDYDQSKIESDYKKIGCILDEAEKDNLVPLYLQTMFEQYVFADVWQREKFKNNWIKRVMNRQSEDFFPSPTAVLNIYLPNEK